MSEPAKFSQKQVIHVARIRLTRETGMGGVACEWRDAFIRRGYQFTHVGLDEVPAGAHPSIWHRRARAWIAKQGWNLDTSLWLVHEAGGGVFTSEGRRTIVFSHGIERRGRQLMKPPRRSFRQKLRSILSWPLWLRYNWDTDRGIRHAWRVMVSNSEDAHYAKQVYGRSDTNVRVFKNGINLAVKAVAQPETPRPTILFVASWLPRKGTDLIVRAAEALYLRGERPKWILAGVGIAAGKVIEFFPIHIRKDVVVIEQFSKMEEPALFANADIFVLPTFFEGQSLALLQGMAHSLCCITTDCCGQKDIIKHGVNGLLFPPGEVESFVDCLVSAISNPHLRGSLGRAAGISVADRDWIKVSDEFVDWIEKETNAADD